MKINELAKLYDITPHTLRYYEKIGLLTADYEENGYRNYSYEHLQKLNTIRDLRYFHIPLEEIASYLENKTIANTKELLDFKIDALNKLITDSKDKISFLEDRLHLISEAEQTGSNKVCIIKYPERSYVKSSHIVREEQIDYSLKQLHKKYETQLFSNNQHLFGSIIHLQDTPINYQTFYFCTEGQFSENNINYLQAGNYLTFTYKGSYKQQINGLHILQQYMNTHKLKPLSPLYEVYLVDFHETNDIEEYITRIEVKI